MLTVRDRHGTISFIGEGDEPRYHVVGATVWDRVNVCRKSEHITAIEAQVAAAVLNRVDEINRSRYGMPEIVPLWARRRIARDTVGFPVQNMGYTL